MFALRRIEVVLYYTLFLVSFWTTYNTTKNEILTKESYLRIKNMSISRTNLLTASSLFAYSQTLKSLKI
jgi:hypothetical protein